MKKVSIVVIIVFISSYILYCEIKYPLIVGGNDEIYLARGVGKNYATARLMKDSDYVGRVRYYYQIDIYVEGIHKKRVKLFSDAEENMIVPSQQGEFVWRVDSSFVRLLVRDMRLDVSVTE